MQHYLSDLRCATCRHKKFRDTTYGQMTHTQHFFMLSILSSACAVQLGEAQQDELTADRSNPQIVTKNQHTAALLGHTALTPQAATALAATPDGSELLSRFVQCALDADEQLTVPTTVGAQVFLVDYPGAFGLVPSWTQHALTLAQQERLSACVYVHINGEATANVISMRGDGFTADDEEKELFPNYEGDYWGNMFGPTLQWFACRGTAPEGIGEMNERICTIQNPSEPSKTMCGLTYKGLCSQLYYRHRHAISVFLF